MDAAAKLGRNPVSKHHIQPEYGDEQRLTRDGTAEPVSRGQILRRERGQENISFPCSADHVQNWQPYPVDPCSCHMCDHTYIQYRQVLRVKSYYTRAYYVASSTLDKKKLGCTFIIRTIYIVRVEV